MGLVVEVYRLAEEFPPDERFGLTAQVRDAAVSIRSNITEGHGRASRKEYRHHVSIAEGSLAGVETRLELGVHLKYCTSERMSSVFQHYALLGKQLKSLRIALSTPAPSRISSASPSPAPDPRFQIPDP
jgi:four helix bundle protein